MQDGVSAACRAHVGHRDEDARRVLRLLEGLEAEVPIEAEAPVEVVILEHIRDDGRCPHLIGNPRTTPHGMRDKGGAAPFALHVLTHRNDADGDDTNVRDTSAVPLVGSKISADAAALMRSSSARCMRTSLRASILPGVGVTVSMANMVDPLPGEMCKARSRTH